MIDLHTHTFFSDGVLIPSELVRRAVKTGYRAIAITDHIDCSNLDCVTRISGFAKTMKDEPIDIIAGAELTHVPPEMIGQMVVSCRENGAGIVAVHGETIVEPVAEGTNRMAIEADVDFLAHPGLISAEDAKLAGKRGVYLEISGRGGHSFTNGHVAKMARDNGAELVFNTDAHAPRDLMDKNMARHVAMGAGLTGSEIDRMFKNSEELLTKALSRQA